MRFGYPIHISLNTLNDTFGIHKSNFGDTFSDNKKFYKLLAMSIGFATDDIKFGQNMIFFRKKKTDTLNDLLRLDSSSVLPILHKMKLKLKVAVKWRKLAKRGLVHKR